MSIHRQDCVNITSGQIPEERRVEVSWDVDDEERFLVSLVIGAEDRKTLLADIAGQISKMDVNIRGGTFSRDERDLSASVKIGVEIRHLRELGKIIKEIRKVTGVYSVERV